MNEFRSDMNFFEVDENNILSLKKIGSKYNAIGILPNNATLYVSERNLFQLINKKIKWSYELDNIELNSYENIKIPQKYILNNSLSIESNLTYNMNYKKMDKIIKNLIEQEYFCIKIKNGYILCNSIITETHIHMIIEDILKYNSKINNCNSIRDLIDNIKIGVLSPFDLKDYLSKERKNEKTCD